MTAIPPRSPGSTTSLCRQATILLLPALIGRHTQLLPRGQLDKASTLTPHLSATAKSSGSHEQVTACPPPLLMKGRQLWLFPRKATQAISMVSHNSSNSSGPPPWTSTETSLSSPGCRVSVHSNAKAVVERVQERSARVRFELEGISNSIDVMAICLYRDGRNITGDLRCALSEGDEIMLDYMIGSTGCELLIHCNAAWQGQKPQGVPYATPEEFLEMLYAYRASDEGSLPSADWRSSDRNCPSVKSYKTMVDREQLPLQAAEAPGTAAGVCHEDRQALDEVTLQRLATHMKKAVQGQIHQVMQRVKLESLRRFGIPEEAIGVSSDHNGPSVESYKTIVDPEQLPLQVAEAPGTAAGAGHEDEEALEKEIMDRVSTQLWKEIPKVIHSVLQAIRLKFLVQWGIATENYSGYYSG
ncbi:uncharacterized protein [Dermacentor andersoni]|uniref:uncharacterized protein isoform X6 n=1 Tax=Dermacentor andersoni TaxID=34620 RepID=UPI003B3A0E93